MRREPTALPAGGPGVGPFVERAADAGLSGIIVPDLPAEEADPLRDACDEHGLDLVFIVAPTTEGERLERIMSQVSGFAYVQARLGTTGLVGTSRTRPTTASRASRSTTVFRKRSVSASARAITPRRSSKRAPTASSSAARSSISSPNTAPTATRRPQTPWKRKPTNSKRARSVVRTKPPPKDTPEPEQP